MQKNMAEKFPEHLDKPVDKPNTAESDIKNNNITRRDFIKKQ